jgi:hypothetical protein
MTSQHTDLGRSLHALEVGDWPSVLSPQWWAARPLDGSVGSSQLGVLHRVVAYSMWLQAAGLPSEAWQQLTVVAGMLPPVLRGPAARWEQGGLAVLAPAPRNQSELLTLIWATSRIIWREQQELAYLRWLYHPDRARPGGHLIYAYAEYLRWIECTPHPWLVPAGVKSVELEPRRGAICARASNLRKFADVLARDVSYSMWDTIKGHAGLRTETMRYLATSELVPWSGAGEAARGIQVRPGRQRALQAAQEWVADLEYQNSR